ncbi:MAG TPA: hypothetical protein VLQ92_10940 [Candidatus Limnocylindrales bacterium]|nr:hypothetical protein [Candidatus Limnocylindrales bacterium]
MLYDIATEGPTFGMIALTLIDQTATSPGGLALTGATEPDGA